jgi:hypothetical protein
MFGIVSSQTINARNNTSSHKELVIQRKLKVLEATSTWTVRG